MTSEMQIDAPGAEVIPLPMAQQAAGRLVAVASGKGGVGKTWFAITLAHAIARAGQRVLLFDGDLGLANVDIQLGLLPERDLGAVTSGRLTLGEAAQIYGPGGFDIVAGRSGSGALASMDAASLEHLLAGLRAARTRYDAVVLDLGAGVDRHVRRMAASADTLLVVATWPVSFGGMTACAMPSAVRPCCCSVTRPARRQQMWNMWRRRCGAGRPVEPKILPASAHPVTAL